MDPSILQNLIDSLVQFLATYSMRVVGALVILVLGKFGAKICERIVARILTRAKSDPTVITFVSSLAKYAVLAFAVIAALAKFGIQTASFVAVLGAAGLAVGLALQGSLSNFAAGVLILIFKPFKVGDFISAGGAAGTVKEVGIFTTTVFSPDNQKIIIPNSAVTSGIITNVTANDTRRVDLVASIGYGDDIQKAREVLTNTLVNHPKVLKDPAPTVEVGKLADSSVDFVVRPWVKTQDYWDVFFSITRSIKEDLDKANISIPFPQQDVHLHNADAAGRRISKAA